MLSQYREYDGLEHVAGSYSTGLLACLSMEALAALIVISPAINRYMRKSRYIG
jgi:hypothetical protein